MAAPVTTGGSLSCPHSGSAALSSSAKLTAQGKPVLPYAFAASAGPYSGCTFATNSGNNPCTTTTASGGQSTHLTVGGQPVLLDSASLTAVGAPTATSFPVTIAAGQTKLTAT
jgi:hypothetical protein